MKQTLIAAVLTMALSGSAFAQSGNDHQQHHPSGSAPQTPAPSTAGQPGTPSPAAQNMPQQCQSMMSNMQGCMGMMQQMMQGRMGAGGATPGGGMMGGGMMGGGMPSGPANIAAPKSDASKAYLQAAERMHQPMMEGVAADDPDVAFVRGMIPHHQAAIDMAKVVLQYGKDPANRKLAEAIVREQQREIDEMQEWLKKNAR